MARIEVFVVKVSAPCEKECLVAGVLLLNGNKRQRRIPPIPKIKAGYIQHEDIWEYEVDSGRADGNFMKEIGATRDIVGFGGVSWKCIW